MSAATREDPSQPSSPPIGKEMLVIGGVRVNNLVESDVVRIISEAVRSGRSGYMAVVNASKLVLATRDRRLAEALETADIVTADGMSVVWASRLLGNPLKARVTGIDTFETLVAACDSAGWSVYFLGSRQESVAETVRHFSARHPGLKTAGFRDGYFDDENSCQVVADINNSGADLLFVGMGSPRQELWIRENLAETGVKFALGVGGSFDHFSGLVKRAPVWMQRAGLEWLHRLAMEPGRLWRRYLIGNTAFIWLVLKQKFSRSASSNRRV
ncbi:MAG: WecB/TagA/CpsF family glycosyltransferase [Blastocatellia bacterium]